MDINKVMLNKIDNLSQSELTNSKAKSEHADTNTAKSGADLKLTKENINNLVDMLNSAARSVNERVSFRFHEETNRVIMRVTNSNTDEVIREIPPKGMIRLLEHMHELIGMFVDESR